MNIITEPKTILENGVKEIIHSFTNKTNVTINNVLAKFQN